MSVKKLIPLLDRVLVQKTVPPTKSVGGILLPDSAAQKINQGVIMAVGPGRRSLNGDIIPVSVKEGDKVLLPEFGGVPVKLGQDTPAPGSEAPEYFLFRDEELLGVLTE